MSVLKESFFAFTEAAKANFKVYGHLLPVFAGVLDGSPQIFGLAWENSSQKEAFAQQVCDWIAADRLKEYIMVVEAWAVNIQENERDEVQEWLKNHGSLQDWPQRSEIVMVLYCSPSEEIECTADIIRGIMSGTIGEWKTNHRKVKFNQEDFTSRFQGLFLKSKAGQN